MAGKYWTKPWNPLRGTDGRPHCTKVSPGCLNCWASSMNHRYVKPLGSGDYNYQDEDFEWGWRKEVARSILLKSTRKQPQIYFVQNNMDLFHESIPVGLINTLFGYMLGAHTRAKFLILTKRPDRMADFLSDMGDKFTMNNKFWWGTSIELQEYVDPRMKALSRINGNLWLSIEPMLGPVDLSKWIDKIDWVTAGCETGPKRRDCSLEWIASLALQTEPEGVPLWIKQLAKTGIKLWRPEGEVKYNGLPEGFAEILYR